jgi:hypothetical protein
MLRAKHDRPPQVTPDLPPSPIAKRRRVARLVRKQSRVARRVSKRRRVARRVSRRVSKRRRVSRREPKPRREVNETYIHPGDKLLALRTKLR